LIWCVNRNSVVTVYRYDLIGDRLELCCVRTFPGEVIALPPFDDLSAASATTPGFILFITIPLNAMYGLRETFPGVCV
jgi:hypothetical protein